MRVAPTTGEGSDELDTQRPAAIGEASMKAQRRLGLALSWPRITSVFLFDIAVLALASRLSHAPQNIAWWVGVGVAALATIALVLTDRGVTVASAGASALARGVWRLSAWNSRDSRGSTPDPEAPLSPECTPPIDHRRRFSHESVGVREYRGQLVAVIAVEALADPASSRGQRRAAPSATVPLAAVAAGLRQFEVHLDAIDVVSVRSRLVTEDADPTTPPTADDGSGGLQHGTWLVLRMDPQHNVAAVTVRDSVASTLAAAVERLADSLSGRRCAARPLSGDELAEVDTAVAAGLQSTSLPPGWGQLRYAGGYVTSFWVSPKDITSETLDRLWLHDTEATVVTIRLTQVADRAEVSAWVRYHSAERLEKEACAGLNRLTGRQLAAVKASLPAPTTHRLLTVPARELRDQEQLAVLVDPTAPAVTPDFIDPADVNDEAERATAEALAG